MIVNISVAGKGYLAAVVRCSKFDDARPTAQKIADEMDADVIMFDSHMRKSVVVSPAQAMECSNGNAGVIGHE